MLPCPDDLVPPALPDPGLPAQIAWTVIIVGVLVFELWAMRSGHNTLSQFVQHRPRWFRVLAAGLVTVLGLHLWGIL